MVEALERNVVPPGSKEIPASKGALVARVSGVFEEFHVDKLLGIARWEENWLFNLHFGIRLARRHRDSFSVAVEVEMHEDERRFLISHGVDSSRSRTLELAANALAARAIQLDPDTSDFTGRIDGPLINLWAPEWRERLAQSPATAA